MDDYKLTKLHEQLNLLAPKGKTGGLGYYVAAGGKSWRTAADSMPHEKRMLYSRFVREGEVPRSHIRLKDEARTEQSMTKQIRNAEHEISNGQNANRHKKLTKKKLAKKTVDHQDTPSPDIEVGDLNKNKKETRKRSKVAVDRADSATKKKTKKRKNVGSHSFQAKLLAIDASYEKAAKRRAAETNPALKTAFTGKSSSK